MQKSLQTISLEHLHSHSSGDKSPYMLRTSDRMLFRRCRRLWGWTSHLRQGRSLLENADYFWFGSGIHYALEDYHGLNLYGHPAKAFLAFVMASREVGTVPGTWMEHQAMGLSLMSYYADHWLLHRPPLETYNVSGIPQVEVNGAIDLGVQLPDGRPVFYGFTLDRVIIDEYGRLWIVEYKTAKAIKESHLDVDEQVTAYCWAAWRLYKQHVAGVVYQQFKKSIPALPKVLSSGKVSTDMRQATSAALYAKMLTDMYGSVEMSPNENIVALNKFRAKEDSDKDKFIVRSYVERNEQQLLSFERRIHMELEDMSREDLPLYPNPTRDCEYLCPLQVSCIAMEDGSDWERLLDSMTMNSGDSLTQREKEQAQWRIALPEPHEVELPKEGVQYSNLLNQLPEQEESQQLSPEEAFREEFGMR